MSDYDPRPDDSPLVVAALAYAARGWPVHPCNPRDKTPFLPRDKGADGKPIPKTGGVAKASTDAAQIRAWWKRWPKALIGLATGHERLFIVDFDPRTDSKTGEVFTLDRLKAELEQGWTLPNGTEMDGIGPLPISQASITPSGGVHLWMLWPDDGGEPIRNRGNLPLHVDVRGEGGYIIAPPGHMPNYDGQGPRDYLWHRQGEIAEAPAALVEILRAPGKGGKGTRSKSEDSGASRPAPEPRGTRSFSDDPVEAAQRKYALSAMDRELGDLSRAREGSRGQELNRVAFMLGQFVGAGVLSRGMAIAGLEQAASDNGVAAKDGWDRTRDAIQRAVSAGEGQPRDMRDVGQLAGRSRSTGGSRQAGPWDDYDRQSSASDPGLDYDWGAHDADDRGSPVPPEGAEDGSFQMEDSDPWTSMGSGGRIVAQADPEKDRRCALLPQTDLGNAERFFIRYGDSFRFCPELGWLRWDGRRWEMLAEEKDKLPGEVMQAVFATVRAIRHEAEAVAGAGLKQLPRGVKERSRLALRLIEDGIIDRSDDLDEVEPDEFGLIDLDAYVVEGEADPETGEIVGGGLEFLVKISSSATTLFSDTLRAHAKASEGKGRLEAIAGLVKSMQGILVRANAFDKDREAINVLNGTIRIAPRPGGNEPSVQLFPHNRDDLITRLADVIFDPTAACPAYDAFLARVQPDADDRRFLHQWAGLSATGDVTHHKMAFFWGKGRNGKSTWVDQIALALGDYAMTIGFDTFLEQANKRKGSDATPDLARLPGVRFLRASEPEKGAKLAEGLIKEVTGGEPITARHLNKGFFEFLPSFKFTAQGNYRPKITGTDDGIWARVRLVPWTVRIPDSEIDRTLPATMRKERSGIFNRMMEGLIDLKMNGLLESDNIKRASEKYRDASDALGRFLRDCTSDKDGARTRSSELKTVFDAWAKAAQASEWSPQGLAKAMEDRGYERITSNGVWWLDIELTVDVNDIEAGRFGAVAPPGGARDAPGTPGAGDDEGHPSPSSRDDDYPIPGFD